MSPLQKRVLELLTEWGCLHRAHEPEVIDRLERETGSPRSSVRGRITELRALGVLREDCDKNFPEKATFSREKTPESRSIVRAHDGEPVDLGDCYLLHLPNSGLARIDKADLAKLKAAYSNWDGAQETINMVCRAHSITRADFKAIKAAFGWTHDSAPYLREDLERAADDPAHLEHLVEDLAARGERALELRWNRKRQMQDAEDAARWRAFKGGTLDPLASYIHDNLPARRVPRIEGKRWRGLALFDATDVHIGAVPFEQSRERLLSTGERLMSQVAQRGTPERVMLVFNGDFFHYDNIRGTTTKGTQLEGVDPAESVSAGYEIAAEYIDRLRQLAPVEVRVIRGNHDSTLSLALAAGLRLAYRHCDDVTIVGGVDDMQVQRFGLCMLGFEHGDGVTPKKAPMIMAKRWPQMWGNTRWRFFFSGHLHHEKTLDNGVLCIQLPALAVADRYHMKHGFVLSDPGQHAFLFDPEDGLVSRESAMIS